MRDKRWEDMYAKVVPHGVFEELLLFRIVVRYEGERHYQQALRERAQLKRYPELYGEMLDKMVYKLDNYLEERCGKATIPDPVPEPFPYWMW